MIEYEDFVKIEAAGICHKDIHPPERGKLCTIDRPIRLEHIQTRLPDDKFVLVKFIDKFVDIMCEVNSEFKPYSYSNSYSNLKCIPRMWYQYKNTVRYSYTCAYPVPPIIFFIQTMKSPHAVLA